MPISIPPKGDKFKRESAFFAALLVSAQPRPSNKVDISEGGFWLNDIDYVEFGGGSSAPINFPAINSRWVIIALGQTGNIALVYGIPSGDPVLPNLTADRLPLAGILLNSTDVVITVDMIFDLRPFLKVGASVGGASISEIIGLQSALDAKLDVGELSILLAEKADINGTPDSVFTLNKDETGVAAGDVVLGVERGVLPNVDIRWNETDDRWEFTNDGITWTFLGDINGDGEESINSLIETALLDGGIF